MPGELRADSGMQAQWAAATLPEERIRWPMLPQMEYLDEVQAPVAER